MEVVFAQVLNGGRGRPGLGEGAPAGAAEPLGELVGVCRALGSLGSQCVWSSCWAGVEGGPVVADRPWVSWWPSCCLGYWVLMQGPTLASTVSLPALCCPCPTEPGLRADGPKADGCHPVSWAPWKEYRAVEEVILCCGLSALSRWGGG